MVLCCVRFARESSAKKLYPFIGHHHHHHHHHHSHLRFYHHHRNYLNKFFKLYFSMILPLYYYFFRRRRSSVNVTFTADMVHILPGYPKQSDDSPGIILLAFYLSLPKGISESSIVPETLLRKMVMDHKDNIETSIGGEILSVDPFPSGTEQQKNEESDKGNDGKSKPTNVIIGASVGGGLLLITIAAVLIGCKKTDRYF